MKLSKSLLFVLFLSLLLGIAFGILLRKAILVFFLPLAALLFFLAFQNTKKEDKPELRKFLHDYYAFASMEKDGRTAMTLALEEMDICASKEKILADIESKTLSREDFLYDDSFDALSASDQVLFLFSKGELEREDLLPLGQKLPETERRIGIVFDPFLVLAVLFLLFVALSYIGISTPQ